MKKYLSKPFESVGSLRFGLPFDDVGAPGQGEAGDDSIAVTVDACGEGVEAGEVVSSDGVELLRQPFAPALGEHLAEGADVASEGVEFSVLLRETPGVHPREESHPGTAMRNIAAATGAERPQETGPQRPVRNVRCSNAGTSGGR
ncbi:hypothetical protein ACFCWG_28870 [Streptomyces sp. NPDC056390]|uniref:hypothetical protein n=1 Tax=Streptomyces sp. NPDC056390 TaxID=3345806 RepID=UPI0035D67DAB